MSLLARRLSAGATFEAISAAVDMFTDPFVGEEYLTDVTGVTVSVNDPTKYASNPIFPSGTHSHTWDSDKLYVSVFKVGSTWHMIYKAADTDGDLVTCYAYSSDGINWTRPNIGRHSYDGSTDNNLIQPVDYRLSSGLYDPVSGKWYTINEWKDNASPFGAYIYEADDPEGPYTRVKSVHVGSNTGDTGEGRDLVRRPDGRWVAYWRQNTPRDIYAAVSDTEDATGTWTDQGAILTAPDADNQFYGIGVWRSGNILYGHVLRFNDTTKQLWIDLYTSRDGVAWTERATDWIPLGGAGEWDDELIFTGTNVAVDGDQWHFYYTGAPVGHSTFPRDSRIGRATIDRGRIGQVSGTGSVTTVEVVVAAGATMTVNADASGGSLDIEVQDTDGTPLTGYAEADFDTVTTDVYDHEPTWGGQPLPDGQTVILKFVLSAATLYRYEVSDASAEPVGFTPDDLSGLEVWLDAADTSTITETSGAVSQWDDKSTNAHAFVQATSADQPTTGASTRNGENVIDFAGDHLTFDGLASVFNWMHDGTEYDVYIVARPAVASAPDDVYQFLGTNRVSSSNNGVRLTWDDRNSVGFDERVVHQVSNGSGSVVANVTGDNYWTANTWAVIRARTRPSASSSRSKLELNRASPVDEDGSGTATSNDASYPLDIGAAGDGIFPLTGAIGELVIVRGRILTTAEQDELYGYFADKWNLTI